MITRIEQEAMNAICSLNRKTKDATKIDWEQRRYEIAKEILCGAYVVDQAPEKAANDAVAYADALIAALKESQTNKTE